MAGSRIPNLSTIFGRVHGLLRTGAMKDVDKPLWYDVYAAFPPKPNTASADGPVPIILYPEDRIRAKFYQRFGPFGTVNLLNTSAEYRSLSQEFIMKHQEIARQDTSLTPDEVFEETVAVMRAKGMLPSGGRSERAVDRREQQKQEMSKTSNLNLSKIME